MVCPAHKRGMTCEYYDKTNGKKMARCNVKEGLASLIVNCPLDLGGYERKVRRYN